MVRTDNKNGIIDTDILIDVSKDNDDSIRFLTGHQDADIRVSIITAIELVVGCRNKTELNHILKFLQNFTILPITVTSSQIAYQLIETFALSHGLLMADALIAATVLEQETIL
ncbi:type II toxin-antitoxin system VapC family toxin, partial [Candidatus Poribacteria bacterium]|nr:type II toxin-antitoxin system VapC family toxin [Candidatus Poribacteria bacterium]